MYAMDIWVYIFGGGKQNFHTISHNIEHYIHK